MLSVPFFHGKIVLVHVLLKYILSFEITPVPDKTLMAEFKNIPMVTKPPTNKTTGAYFGLQIE